MTTWHAPTDSPLITSPFGPRTPIAIPGGGTTSTFHAGVDFHAPEGANIYAAGDGHVYAVSTSTARGKVIRIRHADGSTTLYQHLSQQVVANGVAVAAGQVIGLAGSTGNTTGPHLHFEAVEVGQTSPSDPIPYLAARGVEPWGSGEPTPEPTPEPEHSAVLRQGSTGAAVKELQRVLNAWYPRRRALVVDGYFGPLTERFVRYMQGRERLEIDGIAGPITQGRLGLS